MGRGCLIGNWTFSPLHNDAKWAMKERLGCTLEMTQKGQGDNVILILVIQVARIHIRSARKNLGFKGFHVIFHGLSTLNWTGQGGSKKGHRFRLEQLGNGQGFLNWELDMHPHITKRSEAWKRDWVALSRCQIQNNITYIRSFILAIIYT